MKRIMSIVVITGALLFTINCKVSAQGKFGYFDFDKVVAMMPGISEVDNLLAIYERDSIAAEYNSNVSELKRLETDFKSNSAGLSLTEAESLQGRITQLRYTIQNWEAYKSQVMQQKQQQLMQPFYTKVIAAFHEVVTEGKYTYVFKKDGLWIGPPADDLNIPTAKKLGLTLP